MEEVEGIWESEYGSDWREIICENWHGRYGISYYNRGS